MKPSAASTTSTAPNSPAPNSANWEDLRDADRPPGLRRLGRTLARWQVAIVNWHHARVSNGPTEPVNTLIKRVQRAAFGFQRGVGQR